MITRATTRCIAIASVGLLFIGVDPGLSVEAGSRCYLRQSISPAQLLAQGKFYQSSNDFSDRAAEQYRLVINLYPASKEARSAQFYLGTYYQKKFFFLKYSQRVDDQAALRESDAAFSTYINKYGKEKIVPDLADAHHSLILTKLAEGDAQAARSLALQMQAVAGRDKDVYIYQVAWSPNREDVIDGNFDAKTLAAFTLKLIDSKAGLDDLIAQTRAWCREQKKRPQTIRAKRA